jgi:hypothetical protein
VRGGYFLGGCDGDQEGILMWKTNGDSYTERELSACTCDWDGDCDEGRMRYTRTPKVGCPTHAEDDGCQAVELLDSASDLMLDEGVI